MFIAKDLKKRHAARDALVRHLSILEQSRISTLREQGRLEFVGDDILSYGFNVPKGGNLWIRLLSAAWPTDNDLIILHPVIKKKNKLQPADIAHAKANLATLRLRCGGQ